MGHCGIFCDGCFEPSDNRKMGYNGLWLCPECHRQDRIDFENAEGEYADLEGDPVEDDFFDDEGLDYYSEDEDDGGPKDSPPTE